RVAGVDGQVHQHLLELGRVGLHRQGRGQNDGAQLDVVAEQAAEHLGIVHDEGVQVDDPGRVDLPVTEGQELAGQLAGPLAGREDSAERGVQRVCGGQFVEDLLRVAVDDG